VIGREPPEAGGIRCCATVAGEPWSGVMITAGEEPVAVVGLQPVAGTRFERATGCGSSPGIVTVRFCDEDARGQQYWHSGRDQRQFGETDGTCNKYEDAQDPSGKSPHALRSILRTGNATRLCPPDSSAATLVVVTAARPAPSLGSATTDRGMADGDTSDIAWLLPLMSL
jgi:hypothetical protein